MSECTHGAKAIDIDQIMENIQGWAVGFAMHNNPLKNSKHGVIKLKFQLTTIFDEKKL